MIDQDDKGVSFGPLPVLQGDILKRISDEIAKEFAISPKMQEIIIKGAILKEKDHIIGYQCADLPGSEKETFHNINMAGLSQEIQGYIGDTLASPNIPAGLAQAIRRQDITEMKRFFKEKCRSRLADDARDPRFRAIRSVLKDASECGGIQYRAGRGLYSKSGDDWGSYAFSSDGKLEVIQGTFEAESLRDWPIPPSIEHVQTQKDLVLAAATFFWKEAAQRYGPCMILISELKRYMEAVISPQLMQRFMPDPTVDSVSLSGSGDDEETAWRDDGLVKMDDIPEESSLWGDSSYENNPEYRLMRNDAARRAGDWLSGLDARRAVIFCMMFHCGYGLAETADRLALGSAQSVDYHYRWCEKQLKSYCSRQQELSSPDYDPKYARMFIDGIHEICTGQVLKRGCE